MGEESNKFEAIKALEYMNKLRVNDRQSNAKLYVIKQSDNINFTNDNDIEEVKELFWKKLGVPNGKEPSNIKTSIQGGSDEDIVNSKKLLFFKV